MHQHQPYSGAVKQVYVIRKYSEFSLLDDFAAERDDEGFAAKRMKVWRRRAEPGDKLCVG